MINIRIKQYETNSSSVHVFCISNEGTREIPSEIRLSELVANRWDYNDGDCVKNKIQICYDIADEQNKAEAFLTFLNKNGVNIIYDLEDEDTKGLGVFSSDKEMADFIFNSESKSFDTDNNYTERIIEDLEKEGWTNIRKYSY